MTALNALNGSNALTVRVEPAAGLRVAAVTAALATLPLSYREAGRDAEVVVISGEPGWDDRVRAAARTGARGVLVTDPVPLPTAATMQAEVPDCVIALAETWASHPLLRSAAEQFAEPIGRAHLIDAHSVEPATGRSLRAVLFAQLRAVQNLGIGVVSLAIAAETPSSILGVGRSASGARIALSAARSDTSDGSLDLLLVGRAATIRLALPDSGAVRPGRAVLTSESDARELPTAWQSPLRTSLLALHDALSTGTSTDQLREFTEATVLLDPVAGASAG
jgi:hypothetical protein